MREKGRCARCEFVCASYSGAAHFLCLLPFPSHFLLDICRDIARRVSVQVKKLERGEGSERHQSKRQWQIHKNGQTDRHTQYTHILMLSNQQKLDKKQTQLSFPPSLEVHGPRFRASKGCAREGGRLCLCIRVCLLLRSRSLP